MKKLLLIFILFMSSLSYGQTYKMRLKFNMSKNPGGHSNSYVGILNYVLYDGTVREIEFIRGTNGTVDTTIYLNQPIRDMHIYSRRYRGSSKKCGGQRIWFVKDVKLQCANLENNFYEAYSKSCLNYNSTMKVELFFIEPIINYEQSTRTLIGFDDVLDVSVNDDSKSFLYLHYNWQYQVVPSGLPIESQWKTMYPYMNYSPSLYIKPSQFLSVNDIGKRLYFRIKSCVNSTNPKEIYYELTHSAPHFLNEPLDGKTSCYDAKDGNVTFNFDRDLLTGEKLSLSITNTTTGGSHSVVNIENDIINRTYAVNGLPPGDYEAEVFGGGIPAYGGYTWNTFSMSETHKTTFTINKPYPVKFEIEQKDVTCNSGSDGEITITAEGGTNSGYMYKKNTDIWKPFSNGNTHIETGLAKGTYNISVKDANGCIAKEITVVNGEEVFGDTNKIESVTLTQPDAPLSVALTNGGVKEPEAYGFENGVITAEITGGTKLPDGSYNFTWEHENDRSEEKFSFDQDGDKWYIIMTNARAGTYTLTVTDKVYADATAPNNTGCTATITYTLNQPPPLQVSITQTGEISCNSANSFGDPYVDGELTATASGGVPLDASVNNGLNYYYTWKKKNSSGIYQTISGANSNVLSGISAGQYAVNIKDANKIILGTTTINYGDIIPITPVDSLFTLNEPELLKIALAKKTDVSCHAGNNGSLDVTITGGTGAYTIKWNTGATTEDINGLEADNYTISVTDEKGCHAQASYTITQPPQALTISNIYATNTTVSGGNNGKIDISVSGGTSSYSYQWTKTGDNTFSKTTQNITGLKAGFYNIRVTDKNDCFETVSNIEVKEPQPLIVSITETQPISCYGETDAILTADPSGGTKISATVDYNYKWYKQVSGSFVATGQATKSISNVSPGTYKVEITDLYNNPAISSAQTVVVPTELQLSYTQQNVLCKGTQGGSINITILGGTEPYTYLWTNSSGNQVSIDEDLKGVFADTYHIKVTDARGCYKEQNIKITEPEEALTITIDTLKDPIAFQSGDGEISISVSGGTSPYTYKWSKEGDSAFSETSQDINGLSGGNYTITVFDANYNTTTINSGCEISKTITLIEPEKLTAQATVKSPILCFNDNDGELEAVGGGGIEPYSYAWFKIESSVAIALNLDTKIIPDISPGLYYVAITDYNGISINSETLNFTQPDVLEAKVEAITYINCFGDSTGAIDITVSGGTKPYIYYWSNGEETQDISDIPSGVYDVTILDANACETSLKDISVTQPEAPLSITSLSITPLLGFETEDGEIEIMVTGGTPSYSYSWVNLDDSETLSQTNNKATGLKSGNYQVTVTDKKGCVLVKNDNLFVPQPNKLTVEIAQTTFNQCYDDSSANLTVEGKIEGGVPPYSYKWYTANNPTEILGTDIKLEGIKADAYGVTITDYNGIDAFATITLSQPEALSIQEIVTDVLCYGDQTGAIDITVAGGTPFNDGSYTYVWSNGETTQDLQELLAGTYTVIVTDANNCSITESFTIKEPTAALYVSNEVITIPLGYGLANGTIEITVAGGEPDYSYTWYDGENNELAETTSLLTKVSAGVYSVKITDSHGCDLNASFTVNQPDPIEISKESEDSIKCKGETGSITVSAKGGILLNSETYSFAWYNANDEQISNTATITNVYAGNYYVIVTDSNGITEQEDFILSEPDLLEITNISPAHVICYEAQTGSIEVEVSGGTGNYSYNWTKDSNTGTFSTSQNLSEIGAGNYTVVVTDENGCYDTAIIEVTQPEPYKFNAISLVRPSENNADGYITIEITGGASPYTYLWADNQGNTIAETTATPSKTNTINNIPAGQYFITVTDALGCILETDFNLANPGELIANIYQTKPVTCNGFANAEIQANVIGGVGGNVYTWYNANNNSQIGVDSTILSNIPAGSYYLVVSNAEGISETSEILVIEEPETIAASYTATNLSCFESNNGTISLQASGGTGSYQYKIRKDTASYSAWIDFTTLSETEINRLSKGTYQIQLRDTNECLCLENNATKTFTIAITQPDVLEITSGTTTEASGFGLSNGSVTITVAGGTEPYTYVWKNADDEVQNSDNKTLSNVPAGEYTITITDANQCSTTATYKVTQPDMLEVEVTTQNIILCKGDNGSLRATASGGKSLTTGTSYTYKWFKEGETMAIGTTSVLNNLLAGNYYVIVEDKNGNITQSETYTLTEPDELAATLSSAYVYCGTGEDWTITTSVTGGTAPYTYSWNNGSKTANLEHVKAGTYMVIIKDAHACEITQTYSIQVPEVLKVEATVTQVNCHDACEGAIDLNITGGVKPYAIIWDIGETSTSVNNLCPDTYTVSVKDQKGCEITSEYIIENPDPIIVDLGENKTLCLNQSHNLDISIDDSGASYLWTSDNGFKSTSPTVSLTDAGIYTATVTTSLGCIGTDSVEIIESKAGFNSEFLLSSQAYVNQDVVLFNVSSQSEDSYQWIIPNNVTITEEGETYIILHFPEVGTYQIGLIATIGDCYQEQYKSIVIEESNGLPDPGDTETPFIELFTLTPNPNIGKFELFIDLAEPSPISIRIFDIQCDFVYAQPEMKTAEKYHIPINLNLSVGVYFVVLETAKNTQIKRMMIK